MKRAEIRIATELGRCSFLPASWDKRFCRDMAAIAGNNPSYELSEFQNANLLRLAFKYRLQLPTEIVELAFDEMEYNADRRARDGREALATFSNPSGSISGSTKRLPVTAKPHSAVMPLFEYPVKPDEDQ